GAGDDALSGDDGVDLLHGDDGNDVLRGGTGADQVYGDAGNDRLVGGLSGDRLSGGAGNDRVSGGSGADVLFGGDGKDILLGGLGRARRALPAVAGSDGRVRLLAGASTRGRQRDLHIDVHRRGGHHHKRGLGLQPRRRDRRERTRRPPHLQRGRQLHRHPDGDQ